MKTNISVLVNVKGVELTDTAQSDVIHWLCCLIELGSPKHKDVVYCDEDNGVITIPMGEIPQ